MWTSIWKLAHTKPCIVCAARIEKSGGCQHMGCTRCGYEYCWFCNAPWRGHDDGCCFPLAVLSALSSNLVLPLLLTGVVLAGVIAPWFDWAPILDTMEAPSATLTVAALATSCVAFGSTFSVVAKAVVGPMLAVSAAATPGARRHPSAGSGWAIALRALARSACAIGACWGFWALLRSLESAAASGGVGQNSTTVVAVPCGSSDSARGGEDGGLCTADKLASTEGVCGCFPATWLPGSWPAEGLMREVLGYTPPGNLEAAGRLALRLLRPALWWNAALHDELPSAETLLSWLPTILATLGILGAHFGIYVRIFNERRERELDTWLTNCRYTCVHGRAHIAMGAISIMTLYAAAWKAAVYIGRPHETPITNGLLANWYFVWATLGLCSCVGDAMLWVGGHGAVLLSSTLLAIRQVDSAQQQWQERAAWCVLPLAAVALMFSCVCAACGVFLFCVSALLTAQFIHSANTKLVVCGKIFSATGVRDGRCVYTSEARSGLVSESESASVSCSRCAAGCAGDSDFYSRLVIFTDTTEEGRKRAA
jgi:hypothetical protein